MTSPLPPIGDETFALVGIILILTILAALQAAIWPRPIFNACLSGGAFAVWDLVFWGRVARQYHYPYFGPQLRIGVVLIGLFAVVVWAINWLALELRKRFGLNVTA